MAIIKSALALVTVLACLSPSLSELEGTSGHRQPRGNRGRLLAQAAATAPPPDYSVPSPGDYSAPSPGDYSAPSPGDYAPSPGDYSISPPAPSSSPLPIPIPVPSPPPAVPSPPPPLAPTLLPPSPASPALPPPPAAAEAPLSDKPASSLGVNFVLQGLSAAAFQPLEGSYIQVLGGVTGLPTHWIQVSAADSSSRRRRLLAASLAVANTFYTPDPAGVQASIEASIQNGSLQSGLSTLGLQLNPATVAYATSAPTPTAAGGGKSHLGVIVGAVVGGAAVAGLVGAALFVWIRRRKAAEGDAWVGASRGDSRSKHSRHSSRKRSSLQEWEQPAAGSGRYESAAAPPATKPSFGATAVAATGGSVHFADPCARPRDAPAAADISPAAALPPGPAVLPLPLASASAAAPSDPVLDLINSIQLTEAAADDDRAAAAGGAAAGRGSIWQRAHLGSSPFEVSFADLQVLKNIGQGSFGRVYLARKDGAKVAVKVMVGADGEGERLQDMTQSSPVVQNLYKEASIMAGVNHDNVVRFLGFCSAPVPALVTEYCERGSLADLLAAGRQSEAAAAQLTWRRRVAMAAGAARGLSHLHSLSPAILHQDLKSANLLVAADWHVKITDFNLSKLVDSAPQASSLAALNPRWLAPEVLAGEPAGKESDVFSFGVVLWELLTWEVPWGAQNPWQIVKAVNEGARLPITAAHELPGARNDYAGLERYIALLQRCWAQNPLDRPRFVEVAAELQRLLLPKP